MIVFKVKSFRFMDIYFRDIKALPVRENRERH